MRRVAWAIMLGAALLTCSPHAHAQSRYAPRVTGQVAGFRLAGVEPDGDPLDQVALQTTLSPSAGLPALHLIVSAYLENFKADTTPILPDLLHPHRTANNLGGFLQGKALLTDDAGEVLYLGSFLNEAFLDSSNHTQMRLYGSGAAYGSHGSLQGQFVLRKDGSIKGAFTGHLTLPPAARRQIARHRGATLKPLKQIISVVTVRPAPMMGKSSTGSVGAPLKTGFGQGTPSPVPLAQSTPLPATAPASPSRGISRWTIAAGVGAAVSLLIGVILFAVDRRRQVKET